ncbi:MAG: FAD-dependent oxidoreductase [Gammaproteobacteria bacterium]|nr:FAD-dependent oxidoreductase [Gammaproteobacteria bacterium]
MSDKRERVTRRQVLVGAGAMTAALGAVSLSSCKARTTGKWDHEADIVVVGSGVGACTAAVVAHDNGDSVLLVEKAATFGGTSAKSAGVLWIPNNFTMKERGIEDAKADCLKYMARFTYPEQFSPTESNLGLSSSAFELLEAFYDNASGAVDALRSNGALNLAEWRMFALDRPATDYLDHVPENKVPAGRALGPVTDDGGIGLGAHMMEQLQNALQQRDIPVIFRHRVVRLVLNEAGRVVGVEAEMDGEVRSFRAHKAAIFATGGYVHNPEFLAQYQRTRLYGSCAMPMATGDFINIAGAAGARLGNMGGAWRTQIVLEEALVTPLLAAGVFYPPGDSMLQVNKYGLRAVNEHRNYNDRTEVHGIYDASQAEYPNQLLFMVYDQRTAEAFAGAYPLPEEPSGAAHVLEGESLQALARQIQNRLAEIAPQTGGFSLAPAFADKLKVTLERFNGFAKTGVDADFRRGAAGYDNEWHAVFSPMRADSGWPANDNPSPTMHPFSDTGPYYAIILAAGALDTNGGPVIDARARVLDTEDQPIRGLYGAGNCIASPSREAYYGAGHTLGMSLTFGYIAANAAHLESQEPA